MVKRLDVSEAEALILEGAVDDFDDVTYIWIEVLGIQYNVDDSETEFEGGLTAMQFIDSLMVGDLIEIEDENDPIAANGIADEVEKED